MPSKPHMAFYPVACLLFSATLWGVFWYPLRVLEEHGLPGLWSTLVIYGAALAVTLPMLWIYRRAFHQPHLLFYLALASGWTNVAFILAIIEGNVVRILLLFYLSPIWTVLLGRLFLGETLTLLARITLGLAMLGALVMLWDPSTGLPWPRDHADWLAISSGLAFAVANVVVRKTQEVSVWVKALVGWWGVIVVAGLFIVLLGLPLPRVEPNIIGAAAGIGAIGIVAMTLAVIYGVTHMPVHRSATILLFELVAGAVSAEWLTDEVVQPNEWVGGALIIIAAAIAARASVTTGPDRGRPGGEQNT